jgi:hypothetical protein
MRRIALLSIAVLLLAGLTLAHDGICGMALAHQNRQKHKSGLRAAAAYKFKACDSRAYYDTVLTRETEHFQIFYTLGNGPHATTPEFIDTLAMTLESAYKFHTNIMEMRAPLGLDTTSHFQMPVKDGLYPVEVAELDFLRDAWAVMGEDACHGCYGSTYPSPKDYHKSEIFIDNDFNNVPESNVTVDSVESNGRMCPYPVSTSPLYNTTYSYAYNENIANGIRVTIYHEMFHAIQLRYMDLFKYWSYWIEASATANEELGASDINDYFLYINRFFRFNGTPLDALSDDYCLAILYLYLYNHVDKHFDKEIWELFEKNPDKPFKEFLKKILSQREIDGDSLFHDFVTAASLSGKKANAVSKSYWVHDDQPEWNSASTNSSKILTGNADQARFVPEVPVYAYHFYMNGVPNIDQFKGKASALVFNGDRIDIREITSTASLDSIEKDNFFADSIMWVFSSFDDPKRIPEIVKDSTLRAYPVPWRGQGPLCFTPLPESKKFIEIRNARGDLELREPYAKTTHCLSADKVMSKMKPGVYRFRAGSSGKTQKFLVVY